MRLFGIVFTLGTPMGVAAHLLPQLAQGWPLDILTGWLLVAAVTALVVFGTEETP